MSKETNPNSIRKRLVPVGLLLLVAVGTVRAALTGYCVPQGRSLTDEDFIELAIRRQMSAGRLDIDGSAGSIRDFTKKNPQCCRVDRSPKDRSFFANLIYEVVEVEVNFQVKAERVSQLGPYYQSYIRIRPCGKIVGEYGTGANSPKNVF